MNLFDYLQTKDEKTFAAGSGLPEGETVFDLRETTVEEITGVDGKPRWRLGVGNSQYVVPKKVLFSMKKAVSEGKTKMHVVRQGTGLKDTSYACVPF